MGAYPIALDDDIGYNVIQNMQEGSLMSKAISIRIPDELADQLEGVAKETDRPRSYIIQKALESYLEDIADLQIALERLRDKSDPLVTSAEMRKSLGI
jgi:RHH-type rel operon transcriptional repressor/antitoxin RelB